jgi:hypothetical protein
MWKLSAVLLAVGCCCILLPIPSAVGQGLVCDGTLRSLPMPAGFPLGDNEPYAPIDNQPGFGCVRGKPNLSIINNGACGGQPSFNCDLINTYAPIAFGSGGAPGIIAPDNQVIYSLQPSSTSYMTFIEWTAVDIGTGGAKLAGVYANTSSLPPVITDYEWTPNGPINVNGTENFGACTSCIVGQGVTNMAVTAAIGAGFRSMQLSQLYFDVRCGASGANFDGMYWNGMNYICVEVRTTSGEVLCSYPWNPKATCPEMPKNA